MEQNYASRLHFYRICKSEGWSYHTASVPHPCAGDSCLYIFRIHPVYQGTFPFILLTDFFPFFFHNPNIILIKHFNSELKEFVLSLFWDSCSENPEKFIFLKGLCVVRHNLGKITQWKFKNYWSTTLFFDQRFLQILIDVFTELWNLPGDQILLNIFIIKFENISREEEKKHGKT